MYHRPGRKREKTGPYALNIQGKLSRKFQSSFFLSVISKYHHQWIAGKALCVFRTAAARLRISLEKQQVSSSGSSISNSSKLRKPQGCINNTAKRG
jgi:hypothetical protein